MLFLKEATAGQSVALGPFINTSDGITPHTTLTIANTDIRLSKNGASFVSKNAGGATHDENGFYLATFDATDTDTTGLLQVHINETGAFPVTLLLYVIKEDSHDALLATGTSFRLPVNTVQVSGDTAAANNLEADYDGTGFNKSNSTIGTCTTNTDMRGTDSAATAAQVAALNDLSAADVNAQVVDVLTVDLSPEPTGAPAQNEPLAGKLGYLFMALRNQVTVTASAKTFFDNGGVAEFEKVLSDDGTTYTEGEAKVP